MLHTVGSGWVKPDGKDGFGVDKEDTGTVDGDTESTDGDENTKTVDGDTETTDGDDSIFDTPDGEYIFGDGSGSDYGSGSGGFAVMVDDHDYGNEKSAAVKEDDHDDGNNESAAGTTDTTDTTDTPDTPDTPDTFVWDLPEDRLFVFAGSGSGSGTGSGEY